MELRFGHSLPAEIGNPVNNLLDDQFAGQDHRVNPARYESTKYRLRSGLFVDVKRLRVELLGEFDRLPFINGITARFERVTGLEVFEISSLIGQLFHIR